MLNLLIKLLYIKKLKKEELEVFSYFICYLGGIGMSSASAIQSTTAKKPSPKVAPVAIPISLKLLSVISCPFISTVIPTSNAATNSGNCTSPINSAFAKQASISSASAHSSTGGVGGSSPTTTVLLLLFIQINLKSLSEPDCPLP